MKAVNTLKEVNLLISFLLEIGMLIILGRWGFSQGESGLVKYALGVSIPLVVIFLWAAFAAPKAQYRIHNPWRGILKVLLFGTASTLLFITGFQIPALIFGGFTILNVTLALIYSQDY